MHCAAAALSSRLLWKIMGTGSWKMLPTTSLDLDSMKTHIGQNPPDKVSSCGSRESGLSRTAPSPANHFISFKPANVLAFLGLKISHRAQT